MFTFVNYETFTAVRFLEPKCICNESVHLLIYIYIYIYIYIHLYKVKVSVAIQYSVVVARNGYIRNVVV